MTNNMYTVALIADNHFIKTPDGKFYVNGTYTRQYLERFTSNFDRLIVVGRVRSGSFEEAKKMQESGGENVNFLALADFHGVRQYLIAKRKIEKTLLQLFKEVDALFVRMPCILTTISVKCANRLKIPVMVDVGADPESTYLSSKPTLLERIVSKYMKMRCKKICLNANGVSYVTKEALQKKYPCTGMKNESTYFFTASISNVDMDSSFFHCRQYQAFQNNLSLLHISNIIAIDSSKGHKESIGVLTELIKKGYEASLTFVGDGNGIEELKSFAKEKGIEKRVFFVGRISNRLDYYKTINKNDFFIFPSHSEGLPRVLIESMATGMLCISSNVGGIPELLDANDVFNYNDIDGMVNRIVEYLQDSNLVNKISKRNYTKSLSYSNDELKKEYNNYYSKVRSLIDFNRKQ